MATQLQTDQAIVTISIPLATPISTFKQPEHLSQASPQNYPPRVWFLIILVMGLKVHQLQGLKAFEVISRLHHRKGYLDWVLGLKTWRQYNHLGPKPPKDQIEC